MVISLASASPRPPQGPAGDRRRVKTDGGRENSLKQNRQGEQTAALGAAPRVLVSDIEGWAKQQKDKASRSGAIRRLGDQSQKTEHRGQIDVNDNNRASVGRVAPCSYV